MPTYPLIEFAPTITTAEFAPLTTALRFHDPRFDTMTNTLEITAGDTHIPVRARIFDPAADPHATTKTPVDLEDARATFRMVDRSGEAVVDTRAEIEDPETNDGDLGWVRYEFRRGQTDEPGLYKIRFTVRFPDRTVANYPNSRPAKLLIRDE